MRKRIRKAAIPLLGTLIGFGIWLLVAGYADSRNQHTNPCDQPSHLYTDPATDPCTYQDNGQ